MFNFFRKEIKQRQYRLGGRKDRMLKFFEKRAGEPIGLNEILRNFRDIADPTRTIRYLVADGHPIENDVSHKNNQCFSIYTYVPKP